MRPILITIALCLLVAACSASPQPVDQGEELAATPVAPEYAEEETMKPAPTAADGRPPTAHVGDAWRHAS